MTLNVHKASSISKSKPLNVFKSLMQDRQNQQSEWDLNMYSFPPFQFQDS